jgi:hypothetical protein
MTLWRMLKYLVCFKTNLYIVKQRIRVLDRIVFLFGLCLAPHVKNTSPDMYAIRQAHRASACSVSVRAARVGPKGHPGHGIVCLFICGTFNVAVSSIGPNETMITE